MLATDYDALVGNWRILCSRGHGRLGTRKAFTQFRPPVHDIDTIVLLLLLLLLLLLRLA